MWIPRLVTIATATNTFDVSAFGLIVERVDGIDDLAQLTYPTAESPDADGVLRLRTTPTRAARALVIHGTMWAPSAAALRTQLDRLKFHCQDGDLVVSTAQHSGLEFLGACTGIEATLADPPLSARQTFAKVAVPITCFAAFARASTDNVVSFSTSTPMPQGSARTRPVLTVLATGAGCTDPVITLKNAVGITLATLDYSNAGGLALAVGDSLVIDCTTGAQEKVTALLVRSNAAKYRTMASTFPIFLDPRDGDWLNATPTYPHLAGSLGSGAATFSATYRRKYG